MERLPAKSRSGIRQVRLAPSNSPSAPFRPAQIPPQVGAPLPGEAPEIGKTNLIRVQAPIGFHAPAEIGTAPGRQPVTAGEPPENQPHQLLPALRAAAVAPMPSGVA